MDPAGGVLLPLASSSLRLVARVAKHKSKLRAFDLDVVYEASLHPVTTAPDILLPPSSTQPRKEKSWEWRQRRRTLKW